MDNFTFRNRVKIAYILRRKLKTKTTYRVQISRRGFKTMFKSFNTKTEAKRWAQDI